MRDRPRSDHKYLSLIGKQLFVLILFSNTIIGSIAILTSTMVTGEEVLKIGIRRRKQRL
jgi:hypothetical protein